MVGARRLGVRRRRERINSGAVDVGATTKPDAAKNLVWYRNVVDLLWQDWLERTSHHQTVAAGVVRRVDGRSAGPEIGQRLYNGGCGGSDRSGGHS